MSIPTIAKKQFLSILSLSYIVSDEFLDFLEANEGAQQFLNSWYKLFEAQRDLVFAGYPKCEVYQEPYLEDLCISFLEKFSVRLEKVPHTRPVIFLSHDLDYLWPTVQLRAKSFVRSKSYRDLFYSSKSFLKSVEAFLSFDKLGGEESNSTVFVANPYPQSGIARIKQWVLDPSYNSEHPLFIELKELLRAYKPSIGIHGGYYSLSESTLVNEINGLEKSLGETIKLSRQHWLNLSEKQGHESLFNAGIRVDSSWGFNNHLAFRGGVGRAFPLYVNEEESLIEIPMLIMDGTLFYEMKLTEDEAYRKCCRVLDKVFERKGQVAINWHGRGADPHWSWISLYKKVVEYCQGKGFDFRKMPEASEVMNAHV